MSEPNPNGANGNVSDPREQVMWDLYVKNNLENAYQCAIDAGYEKSTATTITVRGWFIERLQRLKRKEMLSDAEKVLQKTLKYKTEKDDGEIKTDLLRVQTDVAKHITKTLGKDVGYSEKQEIDHTSKGEKIYNWSQYGNNPIPSAPLDQNIPREQGEMESDSQPQTERKNNSDDQSFDKGCDKE